MAEIKLTTTRWELEKARFFLGHTKETLQSSPPNTKSFHYFAEATIVFGRSVTFCMQYEARKNPETEKVFDEWYSMLRLDDPLFKFFNEARNIIIHEHPVPLLYQLSLTFTVKSSLTGTFTIIHKSPDGIVCTEHGKIESPQKPEIRPRVATSDEIFFRDPKTGDTYPVLPSLEQYLKKLEAIVVACEEYLNKKLRAGESYET